MRTWHSDPLGVPLPEPFDGVYYDKRITSQPKGLEKLWSLVMHKSLTFEVRPWGPNQHFGPLGCKGCPIPQQHDRAEVPRDEYLAKDLPWMPLVHWAAGYGHLSLLSAVRESLGPLSRARTISQ